MARSGPLLTEVQWKKIAPLLPKPLKHCKGGRPWIENRRVLEGILWILRSGARWQDLPEEYPHPSTCWRRLRDWRGAGVWMKVWRAFLKRIERTPAIKVERILLGRELCSREKRGCGVGKTKRGKGTKWMVVVDGRGLPLGELPSLCIPGGSPARGNDARDDPRRSASSCRASPAEARAGDCRQSLRQRSVARAAGTARNRTDRAASLQPQETGDARWPSAAAVPASLDRRTHQRLARKLPPLGGALRSIAHDLSRVFSYRLLHDRLTEGCAIASKHLGSWLRCPRP